MTARPVPPTADVARAAMALAEMCVLWDGAGEDGCVACEGEWGDGLEYIVHKADCPIPVVRLAMIARLVETDPPADSRDGRRLLALVEAQEAHEKATP